MTQLKSIQRRAAYTVIRRAVQPTRPYSRQVAFGGLDGRAFAWPVGLSDGVLAVCRLVRALLSTLSFSSSVCEVQSAFIRAIMKCAPLAAQRGGARRPRVPTCRFIAEILNSWTDHAGVG
ncbi:hypothetical protein V5799_026877 [Amblyomma americanum]|uniref:Uncharacterized protein n=1 Tax=Amblyomma americanum TaxID=6943 RepID=A0AAQ4DHB8_AMBAM